MRQRQIHYDTAERVERYKKLIENNEEITPQNKQVVLDFYEICKAKGLSNARLSKTLWIMRNLGIWMGEIEFKNATQKNLVSLVNTVQDKGYMQSTVIDYKTMLKKFYRNMFSDGKTAPQVIAWLNLKPMKEMDKIDAAQIFLEDEILRILQAENNPKHSWAKTRNRAMIAFLFDSGVRVGELLSLRIGDIKPNGSLWHVTVVGKTGQRSFPIFPSIPYLKEYLEMHPRASEHDAHLWCSFNDVNNPISYNKVYEILRNAVKRAGINKPANPHNFRHSAVTRDAAFMSDQKLKKKYGWTKNSEQLAVYSHIRLEDLEDSYRQFYNLEQAKVESSMMPKLCPFCHAENHPHEVICQSCKNSLNIKDLLETKNKEEAFDELVVELLTSIAETNPKIKEKAIELARKKGIEGMLT